MKRRKDSIRHLLFLLILKRKTKPVNLLMIDILVPFYVSNESKSGFSDDLSQLVKTMDEEMFYMYRYKTAYCPQKNIKHDWA